VSGPNIRVIEAPVCEPVSLEEAKAWLRVEVDTEDALIEMLIQAARERAEEITGRAFVQRQLEAVYDAFPVSGGEIEIPCAPLISVDYIQYLDPDGNWQSITGSPESWRSDTVRQPGRIEPLDPDWPATLDAIGAVKIGFTCGYAFTGSPQDDAQRDALPSLVRQWMQARLGSFFDIRQSLVIAGQFQQPPRDFVDGLLDGLIVRKRFA
jgi:uncharacterized phiE125 gp8 family phage protein